LNDSALSRQRLWIPLLLAVVWLAFAYLVAPWLLGALYRGELEAPSTELGRQIDEARARAPLGHHLAQWYWFGLWPIAALASWCAVARLTTMPGIVTRHVFGATATSLAGIRILVCGVSFLVVLDEHLPSTALLPRALVDWDGVIGPLRFVPGFRALLTSAPALAGIELLALGALLAAGLGWRTRVTLPLATSTTLLVAGILRFYSRFFHTGLVPLLLLVALCFTPCGDALSLDRRRRPGAGDPEAPRPRYGWSRWLCWLVLAASYFEAGLSKLRKGGFLWWHPDNLRDIVLTDGLNPMRFDFDGGLRWFAAPDAFFAAMGLGALAVELAYPLVLVSRRARRTLPLAAVAMHVGILLLQNVAFLDLVALQLLFFDWRWLPRLVARRPIPATSPPGPRDGAEMAVGARRARRAAAALLFVWALRIECFPLTSMQMYAGRDTSGTVEYVRVDARLAPGDTILAPLEEAIPALADARYRLLLRRGFESEQGRRIAVAYLRAAGRAHNAKVAPPQRIVAFHVELRRWDFRGDPEASRGTGGPGRVAGALDVAL
jgi:hypothetical protein